MQKIAIRFTSVCLDGFAFAILSGVFIGQLLGRLPVLNTVFKLSVIALQATLKGALIPLSGRRFGFGFGFESKIIGSVVLAVFPVFTPGYLGAKPVERGMLAVGSLRKVLTPSHESAGKIGS